MQNIPQTYSLTKPQVGIFLYCMRNPDSTQYNLPIMVELPSDIDAEQFCCVITGKFSSQSMFFTRFVMGENGEPLQYLSERKELKVERLEMSEEYFAKYKKKGMIRPFNLFDDEPLVRIAICTTEKSKYLITDVHHIICDGWSLHNLFSMYSELCTMHDVTIKDNKKSEEESSAIRKRFQEISFADLSKHIGSPTGQQIRCSEMLNKREIDTWCKQRGVPASCFFMAAFCIVLSRFTRLNRMGFYTMSHGRTDRSLWNAMGMFVRSVPMLAEINWESDCIALMKALHSEHISTLRHSDEYTMTELCQERGMDPAVYFNFLGWEQMRERLALANGVVLPAEQPCRPSVDDNLGVEIYLKGEDYEIRCQSSEAVNPESVVRNVAQSMKSVVLWMMQHTADPISNAPVVSDSEAKKLMAIAQGEHIDFNPDDTFYSLFHKQVLSTPDAIAIVDAERKLTYAELERESGEKAAKLIADGIKAGDCICVPMDRNATFLINIIAAERIGATVSLGGIAGRGGSKDTSYIIYTSGSTGSPKGVMISHKAKANLIQFIAKEWKLTPQSRICCHSDFAFDASIEDLFPVLTVGGTLYIIPEDIRRDINKIHDFIVGNGITGGCFTTQFGQMLLQRYPDLPMEYLVVGGERMTIVPECHCRLINTYGPTEFTVDATYHVIDKNRHYNTIPIGRPVANTSAYVLDDCLQLLPQGMEGELCLAGVQMANGYVDDAELTSKKFVSTPFGVKVYRTGDLVRWNEHKELEFIGRIDSQLKIRGFRVEPAEIEAKLAELPGVMMQTVQPFTSGGDIHLCAYYVAEKKISTKEMRAYLSGILENYMVPACYIQLEEMPLTSSGKIDKKRLPRPILTSDTEYIEPKDGAESIIANAFGKVLGIENVGANDDFFSIGGTSLNAIGVVVDAERQGLSIALNDVFKHKTPRAIAMNNERHTANQEIMTTNTIELNTSFLLHKHIILLGATGFLGIHILHELLTSSDCRITCPVRTKDGVDGKNRLINTYSWYFGQQIDLQKLQNRLSIINNEQWMADADLHEPATIINCMGNVKHFSSDDSIMDTNVEKVRRIVDFCINTGSNLVHVSTISIAGIAEKNSVNAGLLLTEHDYSIGQNVDFNEYVKSKFIAEGIILDAIKKKALNARIMRVGNLGPRSNDGKFQINPESNTFYSAIQTLALLGCVPESMKESTIDISPVDVAAQAILALIPHSGKEVTFHPYNSRPTTISSLIKTLNSAGIELSFVPDSKFGKILDLAKQDASLIQKLHPLLAYQSGESEMQRVPCTNEHTTKVLKEHNMEWHDSLLYGLLPNVSGKLA